MSNRNKLILLLVALSAIVVGAGMLRKQNRNFPMFWKKKSSQVFIVKTDGNTTTTESVRVCEHPCGKCKEHPAKGKALDCKNSCGTCDVHKDSKE